MTFEEAKQWLLNRIAYNRSPYHNAIEFSANLVPCCKLSPEASLSYQGLMMLTKDETIALFNWGSHYDPRLVTEIPDKWLQPDCRTAWRSDSWILDGAPLNVGVWYRENGFRG